MRHQHNEVSSQVRAGLESMRRFYHYIDKLCGVYHNKQNPEELSIKERKTNSILSTETDVCEDIVSTCRLAESLLCNSYIYQGAFIKTVHEIVAPLKIFHKEKVHQVAELDKEHQIEREKMKKVLSKLEISREKREKEINDLRNAWNKKKDGKKHLFSLYNHKRTECIKKMRIYEKQWGETNLVNMNYHTITLSKYMGMMEDIEKARIEKFQEAIEKFNQASLDMSLAIKSQSDALDNYFKELSMGTHLAVTLDTWENLYGSPQELAKISYGLSCTHDDIEHERFDTVEEIHKEQKMSEPLFEITVISANNLRGADKNGFSDPFCKVFILDRNQQISLTKLKETGKYRRKLEAGVLAMRKTKIIHQTLSPTWNQTFKFEEKNILKSIASDGWEHIAIRFEIWDHDIVGSDTFLGECELIPNHDFLLGQVKERIFPLLSNQEKGKDSATGRISVKVRIENVTYLKDKVLFQFARPMEELDMINLDGYSAEIPKVLYLMKNLLIDNKGLDVEGIFRLAPEASTRNLVKSQLNRNLKVECDDPCVMADLIKVWFRDLPEKFFNQVQLESEFKDPEAVQRLINSLPEPNQSIFKWLIDLCVLVTSNENQNKMNAKNLGIVIGPNLIQVSDNLIAQAAMTKGASSLVQNAIKLFSEKE